MSDIANGQLVAGSGTADDDDDNFASIRLFLGDALTADNASIPDKTATPGKVSLPYDSGTDTQATEVLVDAYERMLSIPPKKARKSCAGRWDADEQHLVAVARPVDAIARTSGKPHSGITYLDPEEWLLFYERGSLEIRDNQTQIKRSLADVWTRAVDSPQFKLPGFRAYAILRRLGYVVHANHELSTLFSVSEPGSTGFLSVRPIEIQDLQN
ncbi:hypothetical protein LPJ59_002053 [Coemansia sp. RSA 2399]|nr:hypothetical protein LPJ59_002053 [Coemansia sp. RSA 2399]